MPRLDDVTQAFIADTAPYIQAVNEAAQAARDFAAANAEALATLRALQSQMRDFGGAAGTTAIAVRGMASAEDEARNSTAMLGEILSELRNQTAILGAGFTFLDDKLASLVGYARATQAALEDLRLSMYETATAAAASAAAIDKMSVASAAAPAAAGLFVRGLRLTGNTIHWLISGTAELLAIVLPAAIAAGAGAFVLYQGIVEVVGRQLNSIRLATEAVGGAYHKTAGDVLGLGHAFQTAQNMANPIAYEILGSAVAIANQHMGNLAANGLKVGQALGELSAKIVVDLNSQAGQFNALLENMVKDLIGLGQVFGNVGHAILNFAAAMPGLAEVLLGIALAITKIILAISRLPTWLITTVLVMEEMYRWGGLVALALARIPAAIALIASAPIRFLMAMGEYLRLVAAAALLAAANILKFALATLGSMIPALGRAIAFLLTYIEEMGVALLATRALSLGLIVGYAAAIGFLIFYSNKAKDATQQWVASINSAVDSANNLNKVGVAMQGLAGTTTRLAAANNFLKGNLDSTAKAMYGVTGDLQQMARAQVRTGADAQTLAAEQDHLRGVITNVAIGGALISKQFGVSYVTALALAQAAGVNLGSSVIRFGKNISVAAQQIQSLIQGYGLLGTTGGALTNSFSALTLAAGLQASKVGQLNQAWDTFISLSTNLTSSFATLVTNAGEITNAIATPGDRFTKFGGKVMSSVNAAALALRGFQGTSAQVWQNFDQSVGQAGTFIDHLRTAQAAGAVTAKDFTAQVAYAVQQLLPFAQHSQIATQYLSDLAQEAGGPATNNFKTLKNWVDKNSTTAAGFNQMMQQEAARLGNVNAVAQQFASTLQSDLIQQLAAAGIKFSAVNGLINTYAQMLQNGTATTKAGQSVRAQLIADLQKAGFSAQQAAALINQMGSAIGALQSKTITITTVFATSGQPGSAGKTSTQMQHGGLVIGPPGIDRVPAMLTAGEAILTRRAVQALGLGFINSLNAGGGGGGIRPGGGGGGGYQLQPGAPHPSHPGRFNFNAAVARVYDDVMEGIGLSPAVMRQIISGAGDFSTPFHRAAPIEIPGGPMIPGGGGGGGGPGQIVLKVEVLLDGTKIGQANRTSTLVYNRRNPTNALSLRVR